MKPINNPFSPGAGSPPPELVGRESVIEQARILFARTLKEKSEKSLILTGLRGVGKTVLLNHMEDLGYTTILVEAHEDKPYPDQPHRTSHRKNPPASRPKFFPHPL